MAQRKRTLQFRTRHRVTPKDEAFVVDYLGKYPNMERIYIMGNYVWTATQLTAFSHMKIRSICISNIAGYIPEVAVNIARLIRACGGYLTVRFEIGSRQFADDLLRMISDVPAVKFFTHIDYVTVNPLRGLASISNLQISISTWMPMNKSVSDLFANAFTNLRACATILVSCDTRHVSGDVLLYDAFFKPPNLRRLQIKDMVLPVDWLCRLANYAPTPALQYLSVSINIRAEPSWNYEGALQTISKWPLLTQVRIKLEDLFSETEDGVWKTHLDTSSKRNKRAFVNQLAMCVFITAYRCAIEQKTFRNSALDIVTPVMRYLTNVSMFERVTRKRKRSS